MSTEATKLPTEISLEVTGYTPPPVSIFHDVFVRDPSGVRVLEELGRLFYDRPLYVKGGQEAERETLVRLGERNVVAFLHAQIIKAQTRGG